MTAFCSIQVACLLKRLGYHCSKKKVLMKNCLKSENSQQEWAISPKDTFPNGHFSRVRKLCFLPALGVIYSRPWNLGEQITGDGNPSVFSKQDDNVRLERLSRLSNHAATLPLCSSMSMKAITDFIISFDWNHYFLFFLRRFYPKRRRFVLQYTIHTQNCVVR